MKKIKEIILGTAYITLPLLACLLYGFICNILGL